MLRVTTVIMAYVKSDQVKQSIDSLKKYHLFMENIKSNCSFARNLTSVVPYSETSCWKEKCVIYSHNFHLQWRNEHHIDPLVIYCVVLHNLVQMKFIIIQTFY